MVPVPPRAGPSSPGQALLHSCSSHLAASLSPCPKPSHLGNVPPGHPWSRHISNLCHHPSTGPRLLLLTSSISFPVMTELQDLRAVMYLRITQSQAMDMKYIYIFHGAGRNGFKVFVTYKISTAIIHGTRDHAKSFSDTLPLNFHPNLHPKFHHKSSAASQLTYEEAQAQKCCLLRETQL